MPGKTLAAAIPYAAVLLGLYGLKNIWAAMGLYHLGALVFLVLHRGKPGWRALIQGWRPRTGWIFLGLGAFAGPAIYFLFPWAGLSLPPLSDRLAALGLARESWWPFFLYYVSVTPWIEEMLWRGRLGSTSRRVTTSDVLFAGYHLLVLAKFLALPWLAVSFVVLAGTAWLWRQVTSRYAGLLVPAFSHLVGDASAMLAVYLLIR